MKKRNVIWFILLLVYLGVLAWCCFGNFDDIPQPRKEFFGIAFDKIVHFIMFLPFPFLCFLAFNCIEAKPWKAMLGIVAIFLAGCLIAAGTEIGQSYTAHRVGDPKDFMADFLSLAVSSLAMTVFYLVKRLRLKTKYD